MSKNQLNLKLARIEEKLDHLSEKIEKIETQFYIELEENGTKNLRSIKDLTISTWVKIKALEKDIMPLRLINSFPKLISVILTGFIIFIGLAYLLIKNIVVDFIK